ncbi:MAG: prolipoprotein diacylglyceryl transferase [Endomicrobium sp.]|nr:prolipoprotein diacylglyceryl transferase [Endomicrobium sp.]
MYPVLFSLGIFKIFSYGLFIVFAFMISASYLLRSIKKSKSKIISGSELSSLVIYILIFGVVGSRILFVFMNLNEFFLHPLDIFKLWHGGLVYYGGFILVIIFIMIYAKTKKINIFRFADFFAPALALGHAIGRIGCFFAGCCYGKKSNLPWTVVFNNKDSLAVIGVHLHPTQLYESFGNFLLFIFLHFYSKKEHKIGMLLAIYFIVYAILRFIVECFRGDYRGQCYFGLSISQIISVFLFIVGVFVLCKRK